MIKISIINHICKWHLFFSHKSIKILFKNGNDELQKIYQWFKANKLSITEGKTKFTLFHIPRDNNNLPLQLQNLKIDNYKIKSSSSIKDSLLFWLMKTVLG